jgi:hypothetical protein
MISFCTAVLEITVETRFSPTVIDRPDAAYLHKGRMPTGLSQGE